MSEATLILPNMRGGCATVGNTVHTLFRVSSRKPRPMANGDSAQQTDRGETTDAQSQASA
jgi:hypothetical protein